MSNKNVSTAVIKRLPRYYRYLGDLMDRGVTRISSGELSEKMNITASQIRQDFNNFGCFGQQGYGYNVDSLYGEIKKILCLEQSYKLIIIGAGNIGQALVNYPGFQKRGFQFVALFDTNPKLVGLHINGVEVYDIDTLDDFLGDHDVSIAVLAIPASNAVKIAQRLFAKNIKGVWNFSNTDIHAPNDVVVENVHLTDSLMTLVYGLNDIDNA